MEISTEKTKLMTSSAQPITTKITVNGKELETVDHFKYLGTIISEVSKTKILARAAQTATAMARLKTTWRDRNIPVGIMVKLQCTLVIPVMLYAGEAWTLNADLQRSIQVVEMQCLRRFLGISCKDHVTNNELSRRVTQQVSHYEDLLTTVKKRKLRWYGHVKRSEGLTKTIVQGTVQGKRRRDRQKKSWAENNLEGQGKASLSIRQSPATAPGGASGSIVHPSCSTPKARWSQLVHHSSIRQHPYGQVEPAGPSFIHHAAPLRPGASFIHHAVPLRPWRLTGPVTVFIQKCSCIKAVGFRNGNFLCLLFFSGL